MPLTPTAIAPATTQAIKAKDALPGSDTAFTPSHHEYRHPSMP